MKNSLITIALIGLLSTASQASMAHQGYDHSLWLSDLIHSITIVSIGTVIGGALAYKYLFRKLRRLLQQKRDAH